MIKEADDLAFGLLFFSAALLVPLAVLIKFRDRLNIWIVLAIHVVLFGFKVENPGINMYRVLLSLGTIIIYVAVRLNKRAVSKKSAGST